jgi:hypothetical protein
VVVNVQTAGEQFDCFEAVRGNLDQMIADQPALAIDIRGDCVRV